MRSLIYYVASSLDGFIAAPDGDTSAFPHHPGALAALFDRYPETCPAHLRDTLGVTGEPRRFDTVLMGYRTFEPALAAGLPGGAYPHLTQIVATHRDLPPAPGLSTVSGDLATAVADLKRRPGGDIWLCGGGTLAAQLVDLIDELQVKLNPVAFGQGIPMLPIGGAPRQLTCVSVDPLPGGATLHTYRPAREGCDETVQPHRSRS